MSGQTCDFFFARVRARCTRLDAVKIRSTVFLNCDNDWILAYFKILELMWNAVMHQNLMEFFLAITSIACRLFYLFKPFEGLLLSCKFFFPSTIRTAFVYWLGEISFIHSCHFSGSHKKRLLSWILTGIIKHKWVSQSHDKIMAEDKGIFELGVRDKCFACYYFVVSNFDEEFQSHLN